MSQPSLLPEEAVKGQQVEVELARLPSAFPGRRANGPLTESIARFGVIQPVLLIEVGEGAYKVADGRNRILNARAAGLETIPALAFPGDYTPAEVLALVANSQRSDNVLTDLQAIEELLGRGATLDAICQATGVNKATVEKRMKLLGLIPELRAGLEAGKMAPTTAERAAGLPLAEQQELARLLAKNGKVKGSDVATVKTTVFQGAMEGLPAELFSTPAMPFDEATAATVTPVEATYHEQLAERGAVAMALLWKIARRWQKQGNLSQESDPDLWAMLQEHYGEHLTKR